MTPMLRMGGVVLAGVLVACGRGALPPAADTTAAATPAAATALPPPSGELASSRTFSSLLGDFQFAVPDVWEQRYTVTERVHAPEYPRAKTTSEFLFLALSGGTPPALLTVIQYSNPDWKVISAEAGAPVGTVVAEGGGRVFVARLLPSNPFPAGSEDAVAIAPMLLNAEQVRRALRAQ